MVLKLVDDYLGISLTFTCTCTFGKAEKEVMFEAPFQVICRHVWWIWIAMAVRGFRERP
jgi:hypothetical protein